MNAKSEPEIDDAVRGKERMIFPRKGEARWWAECFGRTDEEMNVFGPQAPPNLTPQTSNTGSNGNGRSGTSTPIPEERIVIGTETAEGATGAGTMVHPPPTHAVGERTKSMPNSPTPFDAAAALGQDLKQGFVASIEKLGIGSASGARGDRGASPASGTSRLSADAGRDTARLSADASRDATRLSADLGGQNGRERSRSRSKEVRKEVEVEMQ